MQNLLLGVHCSVAGGLDKAFDEAARLDINAFQIFSRNQRQWKCKPITELEMETFSGCRSCSSVKSTFSHSSYLINLGSNNDEIWNKSVEALQAEVERCSNLGLAYTVLHPGAAGTQSIDEAMGRIATGLIKVIENTPNSEVIILLENTAGQGTSIGGKFENLAMISKLVNSKRIAYCFDTCHALAAGYDVRSKMAFEDTMDQFDKILGLENLKVFHLNDSKGDLGSRLDRHQHIGQGKVGLEAFREIMQRFPHIPKVLETPKENNMDEVNLRILKELI